MAQAGIHGMLGLAVRRWAPDREGLILGVVLGNLLPDADNLAVAVATLSRLPTDGLHRTFTHSLLTIAAVVVVSYAASRIGNRPRWGEVGLGLGIGMAMHVLVDLLVWFNGVEVLWPIPSWVDLWSGVAVPGWWQKLMMPAEFLCFALFFLWLDAIARRQGRDRGAPRSLRAWAVVQGVLFVVFTVLVYAMQSGFTVPFGALYLLSLGLASGLAIRVLRQGRRVPSEPRR